MELKQSFASTLVSDVRARVLVMLNIFFQNPETVAGKENKLKNMFKICMPRNADPEVKSIDSSDNNDLELFLRNGCPE